METCLSFKGLGGVGGGEGSHVGDGLWFMFYFCFLQKSVLQVGSEYALLKSASGVCCGCPFRVGRAVAGGGRPFHPEVIPPSCGYVSP